VELERRECEGYRDPVSACSELVQCDDDDYSMRPNKRPAVFFSPPHPYYPHPQMICNQCHKCNNCILRRLSSPPLLQSMAPSFEPEGTNVIRLHSVRSMQRRAAAASQKFCQSAPPTHVLTLEQETFFTRGAFAAGAMQREPASWMKTRQKTPFHISKECGVLFSISHIEVLFTLISNLEGRKEGGKAKL